MKEDLVALSHVPRHEKKLLLKGWNSSLQDVTKPLPLSKHENDNPSSKEVGQQKDDRSNMIQWLKMSSASNESSRVGLDGPDDDSNNSNVITSDNSNFNVEPLPKTVAQVKHSYKVRARHEEKAQAKKAAEEIKLRRAQVLLYETEKAGSKIYEGKIQSIRKKRRDTRQRRPNIVDEEDHLSEQQQQQQQQQQIECLVYRICNLNASAICLKRDFRDEVLGKIRKELVNGKNVMLENDCQITGESLSDTKLMMQQLCNQSLFYCIRDQEILPQVLDDQKVRLLLVSKVKTTSTATTTTTTTDPIKSYQHISYY
jgi:hypothetical protein